MFCKKTPILVHFWPHCGCQDATMCATLASCQYWLQKSRFKIAQQYFSQNNHFHLVFSLHFLWRSVLKLCTLPYPTKCETTSHTLRNNANECCIVCSFIACWMYRFDWCGLFRIVAGQSKKVVLDCWIREVKELGLEIHFLLKARFEPKRNSSKVWSMRPWQA